MTVGYTQLNAATTVGDKMETSVSADASVKTQHAVACALVAGVPTGVATTAPMPVATPAKTRIQSTPTISSGAAYATGDVLGTLQTLANAARISGGSGTVLSVTVLDKTQAQRANIDLLFFDRTVTVAADNAPVAMSDADMANCLGVISLTTYNTAWPGTPLNSVETTLAVNLPFVLSGTSLFVVAVVRGTPTYTSTSDLIFSYVIQQD